MTTKPAAESEQLTTPSEAAKSIGRRMLAAEAQGKFDGEYWVALLGVSTEIDQALAPVRECLEGLRGPVGGDCWCSAEYYDRHPVNKPYQHSAACLAAQQLMERLKQS